MLHEHPIKIFRYTAKNLWLLIFPLLRSAHFIPFSAKEAAAKAKGGSTTTDSKSDTTSSSDSSTSKKSSTKSTTEEDFGADTSNSNN